MTKPKWKDVDPVSGKIYWSKSHGWITPEAFSSYMKSREAAAKRFNDKHPKYWVSQEAKHGPRNREKRRIYYLENKTLVKERAIEWAKQNPEKYREVQRKRKLKAYRENPTFAARSKASCRIKCALRKKGFTSRKGTIRLLGCSAKELASYLESKFLPGMNWSNWTYDGWHVDHIIPLSKATCVEEIEKLCHYTNLQPLWAKDNIRKSNKITIKQEQLATP